MSSSYNGQNVKLILRQYITSTAHELDMRSINRTCYYLIARCLFLCSRIWCIWKTSFIAANIV